MAQPHGIGQGIANTIDKPLPSNVEAEKHILGCMLLDNETIEQALELGLTTEDMHMPSHRRILAGIYGVYERPAAVDPLTLMEQLKADDDLEAVGGMAYIATLTDGAVKFSNITNYVTIVRDKAKKRRLAKAGNNIMLRALDDAEPADVLIQQAQADVEFADTQIERSKFVSVGDLAQRCLEKAQESALSGQIISGLLTGFNDLDYQLCGLQREDLIITAARPSMGKTTYALGIAVGVAQAPENNDPVIAFFETEMRDDSLTDKLLCMLARVDFQRYRTRQVRSEEWQRLHDAATDLKKMRILINDGTGLTPSRLRRETRKLKRQHERLDLVIVDYLQNMRAETGGRSPDKMHELVGSFSQACKDVAREQETCVLALSQLSRECEKRTDKRPMMSDLGESGRIERDADVVQFLYRDDYYNPETDKQNIAEVITAKQRMGPTGTTELVFLKQLGRFENKWSQNQF